MRVVETQRLSEPASERRVIDNSESAVMCVGCNRTSKWQSYQTQISTKVSSTRQTFIYLFIDTQISAYLDVRSDKSDTNWLLLDYEVSPQASSYHHALNYAPITTRTKHPNPSHPQVGPFRQAYAHSHGYGGARRAPGGSRGFARVTYANDKESRREKFVLVVWIGPGCKVMRKAKVGVSVLCVLGGGPGARGFSDGRKDKSGNGRICAHTYAYIYIYWEPAECFSSFLPSLPFSSSSRFQYTRQM
jgi:hypothetical protein